MNMVSRRPTLRDLPLAARSVLAAYLATVGIGYFAALVQLHFHHASPGKLLPTADDTVSIYHGRTEMSQLERLLVSDENRAFNGSGSMRQSFTSKSAAWKGAIKRRAQSKKISLTRAEEELRSERDGERLALLSWIRAGANRKEFEDNQYVLPANLASRPMSPDMIDESMEEGVVRVKIASIIENRCTRCHRDGAGGAGSRYPLESWEDVHEYCTIETAGSGPSLPKLAQSTHVHLLGFAVLYGLTGLVFGFSGYPGWLRAVLAPLPLVAQVADISCWWLARIDPMFAKAIIVTGGLAASTLGLQILLSLWDLFGKFGKTCLVALILAAGIGGYVVKQTVIDPYIAKEAIGATQRE
jgi:hypothetical protein